MKLPIPSPARPCCRRAFTMIEVLATVTIIGVIAVMVIPQISKIQSTGKQTQCASNLRQLGIVLLQYAGDNKGALPQGGTWDKDIAPYLNLPVDSTGMPANSKVFQCPADPKSREVKHRSYAASRVEASAPEGQSPVDQKGVFGRSETYRSRSLASLNFPSMTIMLCERYETNANNQYGQSYAMLDGWTGNATPPKLPNGQVLHGKGQNYLMCDGHVEFLLNEEVTKSPPTVPGWRGGRFGIGPR